MPRRWVWSRAVALSSRSAAPRRCAPPRSARPRRRREAADRARLDELERRLAELPAVREVCAGVVTRVAALRERCAALIARLDEPQDADAALDRGGLRELAEREAGLRRRLDEAGERRTAVQVALARLDDTPFFLTVPTAHPPKSTLRRARCAGARAASRISRSATSGWPNRGCGNVSVATVIGPFGWSESRSHTTGMEPPSTTTWWMRSRCATLPSCRPLMMV